MPVKFCTVYDADRQFHKNVLNIQFFDDDDNQKNI